MDKLILGLALILTSCSVKTDFEKRYLLMKQIETPLHVDSESKDYLTGINYDSVARSGTIYGRLFFNEHFYSLINLVPADDIVPELVTYDKNGDKIDSWYFFRNPGTEPGFRSREYITINADQSIVFVDSTLTWDSDSLMNEIPGTEKLEIVRERFVITQEGHISKLE